MRCRWVCIPSLDLIRNQLFRCPFHVGDVFTAEKALWRTYPLSRVIDVKILGEGRTLIH